MWVQWFKTEWDDRAHSISTTKSDLKQNSYCPGKNNLKPPISCLQVTSPPGDLSTLMCLAHICPVFCYSFSQLSKDWQIWDYHIMKQMLKGHLHLTYFSQSNILYSKIYCLLTVFSLWSNNEHTEIYTFSLKEGSPTDHTIWLSYASNVNRLTSVFKTSWHTY